MTDSPEPFFYRLSMGVLLSLAAANLVPVDIAFDEDPAAAQGPDSVSPALARR